MENATASLPWAVNRFPRYRGCLEELRENASFQSLCTEYEDCAVALDHWQRAAGVEAQRLREEYAVLLRELEEEILGYLAKTEQGPTVSGR
jgi:hypothetical protein